MFELRLDIDFPRSRHPQPGLQAKAEIYRQRRTDYFVIDIIGRIVGSRAKAQSVLERISQRKARRAHHVALESGISRHHVTELRIIRRVPIVHVQAHPAVIDQHQSAPDGGIAERHIIPAAV